jgi:hypothetical protein
MSKDIPFVDVQEVDDLISQVVNTTSVEVGTSSTQLMQHPIADQENIENSKLVVVLKANESDAVVQDVLRVELAEQAAYLKILREKADDKDLAAKAIITEKLVLTLNKISGLTTQRTKESKDKGGVVDFHSENFQNVLGLLTEHIMEAVKETGMPESTSQRFFLKLKGKLLGFEDEAAMAYNGSGKSKNKSAAQNKALYDGKQ